MSHILKLHCFKPYISALHMVTSQLWTSCRFSLFLLSPLMFIGCTSSSSSESQPSSSSVDRSLLSDLSSEAETTLQDSTTPPLRDQGGTPILDQGGAPILDQGGAPILDQGGAPILDQGMSLPEDQGSDREYDYVGLGLTPIESPLYLQSSQLESMNQSFSVPVKRFLAQEFTQDTAHLQPWLMYIPDQSTEWVWLLMAFYLPDAQANRLNSLIDQRVKFTRTSTWYMRGAQQLSPIPEGAVNQTLSDSTLSPVCGGAKISARFMLTLPDESMIPDVVGVGVTVSRQEELNLQWLSQCGRAAAP